MLGQRLLVETIIDELNNLCLIEQTHHRSPLHSAVNLLAGLIAYGLMPNKPRRPLQDFHRLSQSPQTDHEPTLGEFPEPPQPGAQLEGNPWQREIHLAERHPFRGLFGGDESPMRVAEVLRSWSASHPSGTTSEPTVLFREQHGSGVCYTRIGNASFRVRPARLRKSRLQVVGAHRTGGGIANGLDAVHRLVPGLGAAVLRRSACAPMHSSANSLAHEALSGWGPLAPRAV